MVNMGELFRWDRIGEVPMDRVPLPEKNPERDLLTPGDLLFARQSLVPDGAGKVSIFVGRTEPTTFESHLIRARLNRDVAHPEYFYYLFLSSVGKAMIQPIVTQVAAAGIRGSDLAELRVPVPPLPEQRAIADVLGALDDKIESNRRVAEAARGVARQRFTSLLHRGERRVVLDDIAEFHNRRRRPLSAAQRESMPGDVPYYGATGTFGTVGESLFDEVLVLVGEDGTVLSDAGRPIVQYIWGPAWVNNHAHVLTGRGISNEALLLATERVDVSEWVTGAVQAKLSMGNLRQVSCAVPADSDMQEVELLIQPLFATQRALTDESRTLTSIRDALLPKLVSGQIRVPLSDDVEEQVGHATVALPADA